MPNNRSFLESAAAQAWLGQVDPEDQPILQALLEAMLLVSRDAFAERLRSLVLQKLAAGDEPVGLYAERELRQRGGVPNRLFKQSRNRVNRAFGVGPRPVEPTRAYDADVGSEGLIAHLVSELCREQPRRLFNHPGPDTIRKKKIRRCMLVTDFIGSGQRAYNYLEAAWRVKSVQSWWSAKLVCFEVLAYSSTKPGRARVESHPSKPAVSVAVGCPTIDTAFGRELRDKVKALCIRKDPGNHDPIEALGFKGIGALIAFAHGAPNNAPRIFHKRSTGWEPLFPARATSGTRRHFPLEQMDTETVRTRLINLRHARLADAGWVATAKPHARNTLLVLAALSRPPRQEEAISRRTGLTMFEVGQALARSISQGWIDDQRRLTDSGQAELAQIRKPKPTETRLQPEPDLVYIPSSLRAPLGTSRLRTH